MSDIKAGDVVELKSGGPKMTVGSVDGDRCTIVWFNDREEVNYGDCPASVLVKCADQA